MFKTRQEGVIAILLADENKRVLLVKRRDTPVWVLPGGGVEAGEPPEQACLRELYEESGIEGEIKAKLCVLLPQNKMTAKTHLYLCSYKNGSPSLSSESQEVSFFDLERLPAHLFRLHKRWLDYAIQSRNEQHSWSTLSEQRPMEGASYFEALLFALRHPYLTIRYLLAS